MGDGVDLDDGIEEDAADVYADEMLPLSQSHSQNEVPSPALSSPRSPSAALVGSSSPKSPHEHLSQTQSMETGSPAPQWDCVIGFVLLYVKLCAFLILLFVSYPLILYTYSW